MELLLQMGKRIRALLVEDRHVIYYEELEHHKGYLSYLYYQLKLLPLAEITVITQGFFSDRRLPDGLPVVSMPVQHKTYTCYIEREEVEEIARFAAHWGIAPRLIEKAGYPLCLTDGEEGEFCIVDSFENAYSVLVLASSRVRSIQYVKKEELPQALAQARHKKMTIVDASQVYKKSYLTPYENQDGLSLPVKAALSLLAFTKSEAACSYEVPLHGEEPAPSRPKPSIRSAILTGVILFMTMLTALTFAANQYLQKDTVAIVAKNAALVQQAGQEQEELLHKEQFKARLTKTGWGEPTVKLFQLNFNGYLGKIVYQEDGRTQLLVYLKNKDELPDLKKQLEKIATVSQIRTLGDITAAKQTLYKFAIRLEKKEGSPV